MNVIRKNIIIEGHEVIVGMLPISAGESASRRQRERQAVDAIVMRLCPHASVDHDDYGRPLLRRVSDCGGTTYISISHSRALAAVAICDTAPIGIDAEENREEMLMRVAKKYLSEKEHTYFCPNELLKSWTSKEAIYKAALMPGLTFVPEIILDETLQYGKARGSTFVLNHFVQNATQLTLAVPVFSVL